MIIYLKNILGTSTVEFSGSNFMSFEKKTEEKMEVYSKFKKNTFKFNKNVLGS